MVRMPLGLGHRSQEAPVPHMPLSIPHPAQVACDPPECHSSSTILPKHDELDDWGLGPRFLVDGELNEHAC